ncbi:MAG: CNNM domain-containing protein, partial [Cephaloticoccus sp.]
MRTFMFGYTLELSLLCLLALTNGLVAMAETAVVSARKSTLDQESLDGSRAATAALRLIQHPVRFLEFVQLWLTFTGLITGILGGVG